MVKVDLRGVHTAHAKGNVYYYAWRGGPRLRGKPGSPEFVASYQEAHENLKPKDDGRFLALVRLYKTSSSFTGLAPSTKAEWAKWLDRVADHFGSLRVVQFDRPEKIRPIILKWRNRWTDKPRTADYAVQVLSRVLKFGVDEGKLATNACEGVPQLYKVDRSETIWTAEDIALLKSSASAEIGHAVDLAAHTGLRLGDLIRLSWSHIGEKAIVITTGKSRHKRKAVIPLYADLRQVLAGIPKRSTTVLTSSKKRPWTADGLGSSFNSAKHKAGIADRDLHFHDLRGTAVTRFYIANLSYRVIAEIVGWEEKSVERIIRRYVDQTAAVEAIIRQIDQAEGRT